MTMVGLPLILFDAGEVDLGDLEFQRDLELAGDLIHLLSSEFTTNADQITFIPANGDTFFHIMSKLYPVVDTVSMSASNNAVTTTNRRADVELTFDSVLKDVLTHDFESTNGFIPNAGDTTSAAGSAARTGQYETNIIESMVGDGIKSVKLTSTNNSGTYRVSLRGWVQTT